MASSPDSRSTAAPGESRNGNFDDSLALHGSTLSTGVLNGMNDEPDIPRFGADEIEYGY